MNKPVIQIQDLVYSYGELKVLNGINLSIEEGEFVTIIGPSGAGKSTLLKCISGLLPDFLGSISIEGNSIADYNKSKRVSIVTQKYGNYPWLTVAENIELGFSSTTSPALVKNTKELLKELELSGFEDYYPTQLSGGMQQRVAIGRAIAQGEEIIAMDEPFGALDYMTRSNLQSFLKRVVKDFGKTVLFITHDIEEAIYLSDRIIALSKLPSVITKDVAVKDYFEHQTLERTKYSKDFVALRSEIEGHLSWGTEYEKVFQYFHTENIEKLSELNYWDTFTINGAREIYSSLENKDQEQVSISLLESANRDSIIVGTLMHRDTENKLISSKIKELFLTTDENDFELLYFLIQSYTNLTTTLSEKNMIRSKVLKNIEEYCRLEKLYFTSQGKYDDNVIMNILRSRLLHDDGIVNIENKGWLLILSALSYPGKFEVREFLMNFTDSPDKFLKETAEIAVNLIDKK